MTPSDHTVSSASLRDRQRRGRLTREVSVVALRGDGFNTRPRAKQSADNRFETRA
jgi:hypothetical protein